MERTFLRRATPIVLMVLSSYPIGVVLSLYLFAYRARLALGRWPAPYNPDPRTLGFDLQYLAITIGLASFPFVSLLCIGWIIGARRYWRDFPTWRLLLLTALFGGTAFLWLRWDPHAFCAWFFD